MVAAIAFLLGLLTFLGLAAVIGIAIGIFLWQHRDALWARRVAQVLVAILWLAAVAVLSSLLN